MSEKIPPEKIYSVAKLDEDSNIVTIYTDGVPVCSMSLEKFQELYKVRDEDN